MTGSTITNLVTISVTLGSGLYPSPLTITADGAINPLVSGVYGATALVATIAGGSVLNQGTIAGGGGGGNFINPAATDAGGIGIDLASGSLVNAGMIAGGYGKYDFNTGAGGSGGAGVAGQDSSLANNGTILGGAGGTLPSGLSGGPTSPGGSGGDGADLTDSTLTNVGSIGGGTGGAAGYPDGRGGTGGAGVNAAGSASTVTNRGQINGGGGGYSFSGIAGYGGAGVSLTAGGTLINTGQIVGGYAGPSYLGGSVGGTGVDATMGNVGNTGGIFGGGGAPAGGSEASNGGESGGTGVDITGGTLTNSGSIVGGDGGSGVRGSGGLGGAGVLVYDGASLTNTGSISGGGGGSASGGMFGGFFVANGGVGLDIGNGSVTNAGTVTGGSGGAGGAGVALAAGVMTNNGLISGGAYFSAYYNGTAVEITGGSLINTGTITGGYYGVSARAGGSITNTASGVITGHSGVSITGGGTLFNAGTIVSSAGSGRLPNAAVNFSGAGTDRLIVAPGAVFVGGVVVQGGSATLEFASAAGAGTVTGIGSSFSGFGGIAIDPGATWIVSGSVTGSDTITVGAGSELILQGSVAASSPVQFTANAGTLALGDPVGFAPAVYGFQVGDAIDFTSITSAGGITAGVDGANDLTLTSGGALLAEIKLDPARNFAGDAFQAAPDGGSGTVVTETTTPLCFLAGTMIGTPGGEVAVERLGVGDLVVTAAGAARLIVWIGTGRVLATRNRRSAATPVIVRQGALADNVPYRDLRLTAAHALDLDGVLIPVEFLVNHRTIHWDDMAQAVELYHVELETHDVLLANGAPAESYRDDGNRWLFGNANSGWHLPAKRPCAPVLTGGDVVDTVWLRLLRRAGSRPGLPLTDDPDLHLVVDGRRLDAVSRTGGFHVFRLAGTPGDVRVASRSGVPQELGLARDPRCLGIALRRIVIRQGARFRRIEAEDGCLTEGFHTFEADNGFRWTDGDAVLPAPLFSAFAGPFEVVLHCAATAWYVADDAKRRVA